MLLMKKYCSPLLKPLLAGVAAAAASAAAVRALVVEPTHVEVTSHPLALPDLPAEWEGARVVHLTDIHYGDPRSEQLFRWMVHTVNELAPDLILSTGDFIYERRGEVEPCVRYISQLRSKRGMVAVLGDHDYDVRTKRPMKGLCEALEEAGFRLLRNERVVLPGGLRLAGIDPITHKVQQGDLDAALGDASEPVPHLLLAHSPDIILEAAERGVPMVLCGHTHGGQVVLPFYGPPITHARMGRKYASGWSSLDGTRMYTGRGLASHYSLRFLCRPELTLFTLERREERE
ncbi:MAG TPA: metallophosphoesterase [Armatimonadota bacterium]|nr:metallophosphoesterase [Armatimonadota bacterium]